ncbi:MAG TPA: hypothetical protein VM597_23175, partial [Gemmataceae bacterium]|nr:hypothetical protein [Gemmataceae bacterium]
MHRLFLGLSLSVLTGAVVLTGCGQSDRPAAALAQLPGDEKVLPGEAKPIPPGEDKPIPKPPTDDPTEDDLPPLPDTKTDPDTLPVLPTLSAPTGAEKYEASVSKAFLLMAENKDKEALESLQAARAAQETDFVKTEIERLEAKIAKTEAAETAADDIQEVLDGGNGDEAAKLASEALAQYGDGPVGDRLAALKRQADALASASLEDAAKKKRFLDDAETARAANNYRAAVLAYEQAVANGADPGDKKDTYEEIRVKVAKYDECRTKAAGLKKDPYQLEDALENYKIAAQNWDTPQVRQEISEAEAAITNRKDRVAIVDFEEVNDVGVPRAGHIIAEEMIGHMRPRYDVVERSQVNALLQEMKLDHVALSQDDEGRTEFGRLARARYVVLGSVNKLSGIHVNARLVDTRTGLVVQTARMVAATPEEMTNRLPAVGRMLQMTDDEKRAYEQRLAAEARPVTPPPPAATIPEPPPAPAAAPAAAPAPIVIYNARPPAYGAVTVTDFDGLRVIEVGAAPPPVVVVTEAPVVVRDRAFFVAVEVGDNCFRRGDYRTALRHFEFALSLNPGHAGLRYRVDMCRPLCPPPVVVPIFRPRLVVLPFAEFRDPFRPFSTIPPGLGVWTANAIAPYYAGRYDIVGDGELYWWMGRLGLSMRDVLTDPYARLCLGRALGARFFLMGALREVASFDATTHVIDAEWNRQVYGARVRVNNAAELRYRLPELANLTFVPPAQQVVVVQQQQVVQRKVVAAQLEFKAGNFRIALGMYKEVLTTNPGHYEARQAMVQLEFRSRQAEIEAQRQAAWQQQQGFYQAQRERQIALAARTEGARQQARRDAAVIGAQQQTIRAQQQLIAQQNLLAQAQLARRQNNLERRVSLLESASALKRDDAVLNELAQAKAELAVERQKRLAAEQTAREAEIKRKRDVELEKVKGQLALEQQKRRQEQEAQKKALSAKAETEYAQFVDQGQKAMAAQKYGAAASAFQAARRIKPSPEVEKLVSSALVEQARADAEKKGDAEKKKLETQLAQEAARNKQLEQQNVALKARYQAALAKAQDAMKQKKYEEAYTSYKIAATTIQTDEAEAGVKQASAELARAKAATAAEDKRKGAEELKTAAVNKKRTEGRSALAAKQYGKAIDAFEDAARLNPADVEIQKELTKARAARDEAQLAARRAKEAEQAGAKVQKLVAGGQQNLKAKQYDAAIVAFNEALALAPDNAAAKAGLAEAQKADGESAKDEAAKAAARKKREDYDRFMRQGQAALKLKQYSDALGLFQKAQETLPGDATSAQLIKDVTKQRQDAEAATAARTKAAELASAIAAGRAALRASKLDEAQAAAERAEKLNPASPELKRLQTDIDAARKTAAAAAPKKGTTEAPPKKGNKVDALLAGARQAIQTKDLDKASRLLAEAAVEDPKDPDIRKVQAEYEVARRQMANDLNAAKVQADYEGAMRAAQNALTAKQYDVATAKASEALKLKPNDPAATQIVTAARKGSAEAMDAQKNQQAYLQALRDASTAMAAKKYGVAIQEAREALKYKPNDPAATKILNDATKAKEAASSAAMEAEKKQAAYDAAMKAGRAAMADKRYAEAAKAFADALAADPGDAAATAGLKQAKDAETAMGANAQRKKVYDAWMERADQLMDRKQYAQAVEAYETALKAIPNDPAATKGLAQAKAASTQPKDPVPTPKKEPIPLPKKEPVPVPKVEPRPKVELPKMEPKPKVEPKPKENPAARVPGMLRTADASYDAGRYGEALRVYQDVLKLAPT